MTAREHYEAGRLKEAINELNEEVKRHPTDSSRRGFLCELLCYAGELDRADLNLDTLSHQDPQSAPGLSQFRHLVRAEQARQQFYTEGRVPELLGQPAPDLKLRLEASILLREGKTSDANALLAQAEEQRPKPTGVSAGQPFQDLRDLDDLTASFFEVLTSNGKYYWIPMDRVELIEFRQPRRPRDLLWRQAHMVVTDGPDGEVFLPTLYSGSQSDPDDRVRLGRVTDWKRADGAPVRGVGLRTYLVGDEARTILELTEMSFAGR
jgi:type VI secretion system protein ImpE